MTPAASLPVGTRARKAGGRRESLESLLDERWSACRKAHRRCRKGLSEKTVHDLRVEIRRLLSTLTLLAAVLPGEPHKPLEVELKRCLKSLARLRDTQVQLGLVGAASRDHPELAEFHRHLRRRERRLEKRLKRELEEARNGRLARHAARLRRAARRATATPLRARQAGTAMHAAMTRQFNRVCALQRRMDAAQPATIHLVRVAFKKYRYMAESLARMQPGVTRRRLHAMHAHQTRMGEIQDIEALLNRVGRCLRKKTAGPFRRDLLHRRDRLVKRFLATADRLLDFRPADGHRHETSRQAEGAAANLAHHIASGAEPYLTTSGRGSGAGRNPHSSRAGRDEFMNIPGHPVAAGPAPESAQPVEAG